MAVTVPPAENTMLDEATFRELVETRAAAPEAVARCARERRRMPPGGFAGRHDLLIVAIDHPARGALRVGDDPLAMADRRDLLGRVLTALAHPAVDGILATPDIIDDLLLLGALDGKLVFGSMNRSGLAGARWTIDDRFTAYDAQTIAAMGFDGGKMLLRIDLDDPGTNPTLEACARAVAGLAARNLLAMIEPLPTLTTDDGVTLSNDPARFVAAVTVAAALGPSSAHTWLKLPAGPTAEPAIAATTLPVLLLGGDPGDDADAVFESWAQALAAPNVRGLVAGRALLYPDDGDVTAVVDRAAALLRGKETR